MLLVYVIERNNLILGNFNELPVQTIFLIQI